MPEQETLKRAINGNEDALREIYDSYYSRILFICSKICDNKEDAEEVIQDTFFRAFKNIHKLKDSESLGAWLRQIAIRECYRKNKKRSPSSSEDGMEYQKEACETDEAFLPEEYLRNKELRENLIEIIDDLPKKQRKVIYMHYYADMSADEIASVNKCSTDSVYQALYYGKKSIKEKITERRKHAELYSSSFIPMALLIHEEVKKFAAAQADKTSPHVFKGILKRLHFVKAACYGVAGVTVIGGVTAAVFLISVLGSHSPVTESDEIPMPTPTPTLVVEKITPEPEKTPEGYFQIPSELPVQATEPEPERTEAPPIQSIEPEEEQAEATPEVEPEEVIPEATPIQISEVSEETAIQPQEPEKEEPITADVVETTEEIAPVTEANNEPFKEELVAEPEINSMYDMLEEGDARILERGGTEAEISRIIAHYGFLRLNYLKNTSGKEISLYGLEQGGKMILVGIYSYPPENIWRMKFNFTEANTPLMSDMELREWIDSSTD